MVIIFSLGPDDKLRNKLFGYVFGKLFGEIFEHIAEVGLFSFLFKFAFDISIKNAVVIALIITALSITKKIYYKEDLYLAFALLMVFHEHIWLSWMLFVYISYFRGIYGIFNQKLRKSDKFSALKSEYLAGIGQYLAPLLIIGLGRKFRDLRDNVFFLILLAFIHHVNYYLTLCLDILLNRKNYTKKEVRMILIKSLKETRLNLLITIILLFIIRGLIAYIYYDMSWGFIDRIFELLSWVV